MLWFRFTPSQCNEHNNSNEQTVRELRRGEAGIQHGPHRLAEGLSGRSCRGESYRQVSDPCHYFCRKRKDLVEASTRPIFEVCFQAQTGHGGYWGLAYEIQKQQDVTKQKQCYQADWTSGIRIYWKCRGNTKMHWSDTEERKEWIGFTLCYCEDQPFEKGISEEELCHDSNRKTPCGVLEKNPRACKLHFLDHCDYWMISKQRCCLCFDSWFNQSIDGHFPLHNARGLRCSNNNALQLQ